MKANEAPEKIYLQMNTTTDCYEELWPEWFEGKSGKDDIEYTRTDYVEKAFIIKAQEWLTEIHRVCDITDENGYRIELRELQARFEKYMKGE